MMNIFPKINMKNIAYREFSQKPNIAPGNRKFDRFMIGKGVYALMSSKALKDQVLLGHLIDINKEGCGIYYVADRSTAGIFRLQKTCGLKFISASKAFELRVNKVVYDKELIQYSTDRISARRCGIKFDDFVKVKHLLTC
jgi:hypothetical protein